MSEPLTSAEAERRIAEIARGLTKEQWEAVIQAIDCLDSIAGEGIYIQGRADAGDALYDLFNAFWPDWAGDAEYIDAARAYLKTLESNR